MGAAKGCKHYCGITLGTGVGGGIVVEGKILHGAKGMAGEIGHMVIDPEGPLCSCGGRGCLEVYASGDRDQANGIGGNQKREREGDLETEQRGSSEDHIRESIQSSPIWRFNSQEDF